MFLSPHDLATPTHISGWSGRVVLRLRSGCETLSSRRFWVTNPVMQDGTTIEATGMHLFWATAGFFDFVRPRQDGPHQPDAALLKAWVQGDDDAFHRLVSRYEEDIWGFIQRRMRGKDAHWEEVLQETFLRLVRQPPVLLEGQLLRPWLYRVCRHVIIDHLRKDGRSPQGSEEPLAALASPLDTEAEAGRSQMRWRLQEAMRTLPAEQAEALRLRHEEGMTFEDIAEVLDTNVNTVKSRIRYALLALRGSLGDLERERKSKEGAA